MSKLWSLPLLGIVMAMWSNNFVIGRLAPPVLPPVVLCLRRLLLASLLLLPWAASRLRKDHLFGSSLYLELPDLT